MGGQLAPCIRRVAAGTALMAVPSWAVGVVVPRWVDGRPGYSIAVVAAVVLGAGVFFLLQAWWRAPELDLVTAALGRSAPRAVAPKSIAAGGDRG